VLDEPRILATFEGFGDSTLNFVLRCYLPNLDNRLNVIHELHTAIDKAFREAGIEIAFPQRDLHIRSMPEGLYRSSGNGAGEPASRTASQEAGRHD
jgi:potassium efflux system protein